MDERPFLAVETGKPIRFSDLPSLIALALHPDDELAYGSARVNLESELAQWVQAGMLVVRNASGLGRHALPQGAALQGSVVLPDDLRPLLADKAIELREIEHGSGPNLWTLDNVAIAIAEQEGWHGGTRGAFLDQLVEAVTAGHLRVRDPRTELFYHPRVVRTFYELVSPADVNAWLEQHGAGYRWNVQAGGVGSDRVGVRPDQIVGPALHSESACARQARRYQACLEAGLTMPSSDYAQLPRGIGKLAKKEGISRQAFSEDVKAHIGRLRKA